MVPGRWDFDIYQGSKLSFTLRWKDENGNAIVTTGYDWKMQIRETYDSVTPIATLDNVTPTGGIVDDGAGVLSFKIPAGVTQLMDFSTAVYDLEFEPPSGADDRDKLIKGKVTFHREATL